MISIIVAAKASIVTAAEKNRKVKPSVCLCGREMRKSRSSNGEVTQVRIERNKATEVNELARERTSMTVKTKNKGSCSRMGTPVSRLEPPGTV